MVKKVVLPAFVEQRLSLIDKGRDVSGNVTMAALLGTMIGTTTTGAIAPMSVIKRWQFFS